MKKFINVEQINRFSNIFLEFVFGILDDCFTPENMLTLASRLSKSLKLCEIPISKPIFFARRGSQNRFLFWQNIPKFFFRP